MVLSGLFIRHKTPPARFAPTVFLGLLAIFTVIGQHKPLIGIVGIGTTLIIASALVEVNRQRIWDNYLKIAKKRKGFRGTLTKPNKVYYTINVAILWPFIMFLGFVCLWVAYALS